MGKTRLQVLISTLILWKAELSLYVLINTLLLMPKTSTKVSHPKRYFSGRRTDTQFKDSTVTPDGLLHKVRMDGSKYPKLTTISLCESTRRIYSLLRNSAKYDNYNDLLLDIAEKAIETKILRLNERTLKALESYFYSAKIERMLMERARKYAMRKRRYYRRETSMRHEVFGY